MGFVMHVDIDFGWAPRSRKCIDGDQLGATEHQLQRTIQRFRAVHKLDLEHCTSLSDEALASIVVTCPRLSSLMLATQEALTGCSAPHIARLRNLQHLDLSARLTEEGYCPRFTDAGLATIVEGCTGLISLKLQNNGALTEASCTEIARLEQLATFTCFEGLTDAGLGTIVAGCKGLQALDFSSELNEMDEGFPLRLLTNSGFGLIAGLPSLTRLNMNNCPSLMDTGLLAITAACLNLEFLNLGWCQQDVPLTDAGLAKIGGCKKLRNLTLCGRDITDVGLSEIAKCTSMSILDLSGSSYITGASDGAKLAQCLNLTELTLKDCVKFANEGLQNIARCSALCSINVGECFQITDIGLAEIVRCPNLFQLDLRGCRRIRGAGPAGFSRCRSVRSLNLSRCKRLTDTGLDSIADCTELATLDLRMCTKITDVGLASIGACSSLSTLLLSCSATDFGLSKVLSCPNLSNLELSDCACITGTGGAGFSCCPTLTGLALNGCTNFTDAGLEDLSRCTKLAQLSLSKCSKVTDAGLAEIMKCSSLYHITLQQCDQIVGASGLCSSAAKLQTLDLTGCKNFKHIGNFSSCTNLERISLNGCAKITDADLEKIESAFPKAYHISLAGCLLVTLKAAEKILEDLDPYSLSAFESEHGIDADYWI
jgi:hypothetical protein